MGKDTREGFVSEEEWVKLVQDYKGLQDGICEALDIAKGRVAGKPPLLHNVEEHLKSLLIPGDLPEDLKKEMKLNYPY